MKKIRFFILDIITVLIVISIAIFLVSFTRFDWREATMLFLFIYLINLIFVFYLLIKNDELQEKFSWVFFLVIFPIISHIIFVLFRVRRAKGISREEFEKQIKEFMIEDQFNFNNQEKKAINIINNYSNITSRKFYKSNIVFYKHGFEAYEKLFNDLENAKNFIHIEMYIIKPSEIFEKFKDILIKKANEGVEIKIIVDAFGSWVVKEKDFEYLKNKGVEIEFFNKTFYPYVKPTDNNRLHRKFFIIDGKYVHSGGLNISDEYSSYNKKYGYWADLNFKIEGKIINDYESIFLYDWYQLTSNKLNKNNYLIASDVDKNNNDILLFDEGPTTQDNLLENSLIDWILNSDKSISIATPYFIPSKQLLNCLKHSLQKGVKLDLFIPGNPDKKLVYSATKYYVNELVKLGANVYVLNDIFLHTKLMIFDNEYLYIGTNNLDMRSLYTNYELLNVVIGNDSINEMNNLLEEYKTISTNKTSIKKENKIKIIIKKTIYELFSPLM